MKQRMIPAALILLLSFINLFSQVNVEWLTKYNGMANGADAGYSITLDNNGNIYVTGSTYSGSSNLDYLTIKYNSAGSEQWAARYNGPGDSADVAIGIAADPLGNVYVTGTSGGSGTFRDFATVKYNSSGVQQWVQRYDGPVNGLDNATGIRTDAAGNVYVIGYSRVLVTYEDYVTIKYNSSGVQQWLVRYNGPGGFGDWARWLEVDNSGNVYVTGESVGSGTSIDYCTIKYNSSGAQQWAGRYHGTGNYYDFATALAVDNSGYVYVTGYTYSGTSTQQDYGTIKYSPSGAQEWIAFYNAPANSWEQPYYITHDNNGNIYVTGWCVGANSGLDYCTVKYNSSGTEQWVKTYNGPGNYYDEPSGIAADSSGNIYVSGSSYGSNSNYDLCTIKYNTSGAVMWMHRYNDAQNGADKSNDIIMDQSGNIFLTGSIFSSTTANDCATIKYSQLLGIHTVSTQIPDRYSLSQNYPNPFNPVTKIRFDIPTVGQRHAFDVRLVIYDILGREIATLVNEQLQPGTYEVTWDAANYPSGVYYYKLQSDVYTETKRMILLK